MREEKMMDKAAKHADICKALNGLYQRKNADYGDSFGKSYTEYGMTMACIRLEDKLNRLKSLCKNEAQVKDESLEDTLMDLANYAIMTLVERTAHDEPVKGDHCEACSINNPSCLCNKCSKDNDDCCTSLHGEKFINGCPIAFCPDFLPEGDG
jgi:hypothetical protein